jgi:hypothetical protein
VVEGPQAEAGGQGSSTCLDSGQASGKEDLRLEAGGQRSSTCLDSGQTSGNFLVLEDCRHGGR